MNGSIHLVEPLLAPRLVGPHNLHVAIILLAACLHAPCWADEADAAIRWKR